MTQSKIGILGSGKLYKLWLDENPIEHDLYDDTKDYLPNIDTCTNQRIYIAIGNSIYREQFFNKFSDREITSVKSPNCFISSSASIGYGYFISNYCVINSESKVGRGLVMGANSTIDVAAEIGEFVRISPNSYIGDNCNIGSGSIICAGVTILPGVHIGKNVYVAAGSVVSHSCGDNLTLAGVPARNVNGNNELHRNRV